jgi:hypothetical protein
LETDVSTFTDSSSDSGRWKVAAELVPFAQLPPKLCFHALEMFNDARQDAVEWLLSHGIPSGVSSFHCYLFILSHMHDCYTTTQARTLRSLNAGRKYMDLMVHEEHTTLPVSTDEIPEGSVPLVCTPYRY